MSPERNPGANQLYQSNMQEDDEHEEGVNVFAFHGYGEPQDLDNVTEAHNHQNHDEPDLLKQISIISQVPKNIKIDSDIPLPQIDAIASSATFGVHGDVGSSADRSSQGCKQKR